MSDSLQSHRSPIPLSMAFSAPEYWMPGVVIPFLQEIFPTQDRTHNPPACMILYHLEFTIKDNHDELNLRQPFKIITSEEVALNKLKVKNCYAMSGGSEDTSRHIWALQITDQEESETGRLWSLSAESRIFKNRRGATLSWRWGGKGFLPE